MCRKFFFKGNFCILGSFKAQAFDAAAAAVESTANFSSSSTNPVFYQFDALHREV